MSGIEGLFNYTCEVQARGTDTMVDEDNHPIDTGYTSVATIPCAVQERSMREQASLTSEGAVQSTHKVYLNGYDVTEKHRLVITSLSLTLEVVGVRDGGGRGHHLEIDGLEHRP